MPIEFPLSCVDPCTAVPALAMLHSTRFQEFNLTSTFSQVLFETADKVMPDRHAEILSIGVDCAPVLVGNLRSEVLVVQSAQNWNRQWETDSLDSTRDRCVLVQQ
jgi:hypothetical protein